LKAKPGKSSVKMAEKRNDIVDKAIEALNKERVPAEPPQSVIDATLEMLSETQEELEILHQQKKRLIFEAFKASRRFARMSVFVGIAAAVVLCVIFALLLTGKTELEVVKEFEVPSPEEVKETEVDEEEIVIIERAKPEATDTLENEMDQLLQMFHAGDTEGLRQMLRNGRLETKIASAYYLSKTGDAEAMELLQQLFTRLRAEPNEAGQAKDDAEAEALVKEKILQQKDKFRPMGTLSGLVLDAETGEPISDVEIFISKGSIYSEKTDANGIYRFEDAVDEGEYRIWTWSDAYIGVYDWLQAPVVDLSKNIDAVKHFELKPACMVAIIVVDEDDNPIENVQLIPTLLDGEYGIKIGDRMRDIFTDADGFELLGGFEPSKNPYLIAAEHRKPALAQEGGVRLTRQSGYSPGYLKVTLTNTDAIEIGKIVMRKGLQVKGYTKYPLGIPIEGLEVSANPEWWPSTIHTSLEPIEPNGCFTLPHIIPGDYSLYIHMPKGNLGRTSYQVLKTSLPLKNGSLVLTVPE
jgi:hypothetical protein